MKNQQPKYKPHPYDGKQGSVILFIGTKKDLSKDCGWKALTRKQEKEYMEKYGNIPTCETKEYKEYIKKHI